MARQITRKNTKSVLSGGFLSKFRRRIRTHTQKIMNRNPLGYIAQFKKAFPDGAITDTEYKYLIMGYGDNLYTELNKLLQTNTNTKIYKFIITDDFLNQNPLINKLFLQGKLGFISRIDNKNVKLITHANRSDTKTSTLNIIREDYHPILNIRIYLYNINTPSNNIPSSGSRRRSGSSHA
jgi:hypothetical protein